MMRWFYIIVFAFIPAILGKITLNSKLGSTHPEYNTCLTETSTNNNDVFSVGDILVDRHKQPENEEKQRKNGCLIHCLLQKQGLIEESEFNIEKTRTAFAEKTNYQVGDDFHKAFDNCLEEAKNIEDKCEKSLTLVTCYFKSKEKLLSERGQHTSGEHEEPGENEEHKHEE
ncbi:pheromone-binding protein Gp-9-like [Anoplolepis gracilipes]|uniref:pheromone-binding protein Gp-9-like n=1 Tax=Anoplolepis gracilipes TaxID=354296 RepID=UPI003B9E534E